MDGGALWAIAHHLAVFGLVGLVAAEFALLRPGIAGARLWQLAKVDLAYGIVAGLVVVVGVLRVFFGEGDPGYYVANHSFWGKMGALVIVGLLSIQPTISVIRWRKQVQADPQWVPPENEVRRSRRFLHAEVAVLAFVPVFAALMARGIG